MNADFWKQKKAGFLKFTESLDLLLIYPKASTQTESNRKRCHPGTEAIFDLDRTMVEKHRKEPDF